MIDGNFSYDNPRYAPIREASRKAVAAFQDAARHLDSIQEWVYIKSGLVHTAHMIHERAHQQPARFDKLGDALHTLHLMTEYPATAEFDLSLLETMDDAFRECINALDRVAEALYEFREICEKLPDTVSLALEAENLLMENSADYTDILDAWNMWDKAKSPTSFDNWIARKHGGEK